MKTFKDVAQQYQAVLAPLYDENEAKQLFLMSYSAVMQENSVQYMLNSTHETPAAALAKFDEILDDLSQGRPIQHILGIADFYGMRFAVNEHTLIPRPETEELVDWILNEEAGRPSFSLLDIGTGSGCIALSIQNMLLQAQVSALDISSEALQVARKNAERLGIPVNFMQADILEWESFMQAEQRYDVIVSNPPYITPAEQQEMHPNVLRFEPHQALFVEEHAPLLFYDTIAEFAKKHLNPGGSLYFEINQYLGAETCELLRKKGFSNIELKQDLNQVDRMIRSTFDKII